MLGTGIECEGVADWVTEHFGRSEGLEKRTRGAELKQSRVANVRHQADLIGDEDIAESIEGEGTWVTGGVEDFDRFAVGFALGEDTGGSDSTLGQGLHRGDTGSVDDAD